MVPFHQEVLEAVSEPRVTFGLVLAGAHARHAHGLVAQPGPDLELATGHPTPLPEITTSVTQRLRAGGFTVDMLEAGPRTASLSVTHPATGQSCGLRLWKEALQRRPVPLGVIPVLDLDDVVGLTVRALHRRGAPRDLIDVAAVAHGYGWRDLERLGGRHDEEFSIGELATRLQGIDLWPDEGFERHGLDAGAVARVRRFGFDWLEDIRQRRVEDGDIDVWLDEET